MEPHHRILIVDHDRDDRTLPLAERAGGRLTLAPRPGGGLEAAVAIGLGAEAPSVRHG